MGVVATLLPAAAHARVRRALAGSGLESVALDGWDALDRLARRRLVELLVVAPSADDLGALRHWREAVPAIPVVAYAAWKPADGPLLVTLRYLGVALAQAGADDAALGWLLLRSAGPARRAALLADAPRVLGLTEPLQLAAWRYLLQRVERPLRTSDVARALGLSREHLSREFAAGGAPNLKRVLDLVRVAWAAELLRGQGLDVTTVAALLGFSSPAHFAQTSRRISGRSPSGLRPIGGIGVLTAFAAGRTRSRL